MTINLDGCGPPRQFVLSPRDNSVDNLAAVLQTHHPGAPDSSRRPPSDL
jgi:hypothetical protein